MDTESFKIEANIPNLELSSFLAPRVMTVRVLVWSLSTLSIIVAIALDLLRVHGPTEEAFLFLAVKELFPATLLEMFLEAMDLRKLDERHKRQRSPTGHARNL
ncbi:hypothetical protein ACH5RR_003349 [Cinchona calisaya]|uniref:Uncharacterized protein n=1 Tax=Cinchona calisaya TaxID=153742 RepID=A0ABD3AUY1_9GENT